MKRSTARLLTVGLVSVLGLGACEHYDRPNAQLPDIQAIGLDGRTWNREALAGKPWVVNLWVPR